MKHDGYVVKLRNNRPGRSYEILERMRQSHGLLGFTQSLMGEKTGLFTFHPKNENEVERLMDDPRVEICEPNMIVSLDPNEMGTSSPISPVDSQREFPNDPEFGRQWHWQMLEAQKVWKKGYNGKGRNIICAVLDTGVAYQSSRDGRYVKASDMDPGQMYRPYDMITGTKTAYDGNSHGTWCANCIGGLTNNGRGGSSLAYGLARLMPVKVLSDSGSGSVAGVADGIYYAVNNGAKILSMSLGGGPSKVIAAACQYAMDHDALIVAAAGNENSSDCGSPGGLDTVLTVAAIGPTSKKAFYSNYGPAINVCAPGGDSKTGMGEEGKMLQNTVVNKKDGMYLFQGTSMATPVAAATCVLAMQRGITGRQKLIDHIQSTCIDLGNKEYYGHGRVSPWNAVQ